MKQMKLRLFLNTDLEEDTVLNNFYKFPAPPKKALKARERKIEEIKKQLGDKYLLATPVEKKNG